MLCLQLPTLLKGSVIPPRGGCAAQEEMGMRLDGISAHAGELLLNRWTMRTPTANPYLPAALRFPPALPSGHFPTDEGKQQIMTVKLW